MNKLGQNTYTVPSDKVNCFHFKFMTTFFLLFLIQLFKDTLGNFIWLFIKLTVAILKPLYFFLVKGAIK